MSEPIKATAEELEVAVRTLASKLGPDHPSVKRLKKDLEVTREVEKVKAQKAADQALILNTLSSISKK